MINLTLAQFTSYDGWFLIHSVSGMPITPKKGMLYFDDNGVLRRVIVETPEYWESRQEYQIVVAATNRIYDVPDFPPDFFTYLQDKRRKKLQFFMEWQPVCCKRYTCCNSNCSVSDFKLLTNDNEELIIEYKWLIETYTEDFVKTLFHKFIDKFDIDTTDIDLEQFFEENL